MKTTLEYRIGNHSKGNVVEVLNVKKVVIKIAQNILKFGQPISKY
jgi:hypothetical protein